VIDNTYFTDTTALLDYIDTCQGLQSYFGQLYLCEVQPTMKGKNKLRVNGK